MGITLIEDSKPTSLDYRPDALRVLFPPFNKRYTLVKKIGSVIPKKEFFSGLVKATVKITPKANCTWVAKASIKSQSTITASPNLTKKH